MIEHATVPGTGKRDDEDVFSLVEIADRSTRHAEPPTRIVRTLANRERHSWIARYLYGR